MFSGVDPNWVVLLRIVRPQQSGCKLIEPICKAIFGKVQLAVTY